MDPRTAADPERIKHSSHQPEIPRIPEGYYVTFLERVDHFTWAWFTLTMSTGGVALLLSVQPYTFRGLNTLGR